MFAASNNGLSIRAVKDKSEADIGEVVFDILDMSEISEDMLKAAFSEYLDAMKSQKLDELDAEYKSEFEKIVMAYNTAIIAGDFTTATTRQTDYATLKTEYATAREAIANGR